MLVAPPKGYTLCCEQEVSDGQGADVTAKSRKGQTTADMANGAIERVVPFPETIALLTKLGAKNNNRCVSC